MTIDTLRADHVGGYGDLGLTPNIDDLASRGVLVERFATPTPTTGPAHASLFTGNHPWRHGVLDNAVPLEGMSETPLAEELRAQGFETAAFVSSYVLSPRFKFDRGFDSYWFEPTNSYTWHGEYVESFWARGEATVGAAMGWLTKRATSEKKFFLWVHLFDPHSPYAPPDTFLYESMREVDLAGKRLPPQTGSWGELLDLIQRYRGEVRYADHQVGRLLDRVRILGLERETLIVVTSDHGEGLGDHGHLEHGRNLFAELVRIPLVLAGPGVASGKRLRGPAQLEDLFPTILSLMKVEATQSGGRDGVDLSAYLSGEDIEPPRQRLFGRRKIYVDEPDLYYVEANQTKWIGAIEGNGVRFDLDDDPTELTGKGGHPAPKDLVDRVAAGRSSSTKAQQLDPETERALRALGYLD